MENNRFEEKDKFEITFDKVTLVDGSTGSLKVGIYDLDSKGPYEVRTELLGQNGFKRTQYKSAETMDEARAKFREILGILGHKYVQSA